MVDTISKSQRSLNMSRIRSKDTKPEMIVRRLIFRLGFRYRLHRKDLPGKPDIVMPGAKKIIFVHGCFFHKHDCRYGRVEPKSNSEYWQNKRIMNSIRDERNERNLQNLGWKILIVWECMTKKNSRESLSRIIEDFLR